jgi:hypothetical protein
MTKAQREKSERLLLQKIIDENPTLKKFLDESITASKENKPLVNIIQPVIEDMLKQARMQGVNIGFMGAYMAMNEKIMSDKFETLVDMAKEVKKETNRIRKKMGLKEVE